MTARTQRSRHLVRSVVEWGMLAVFILCVGLILIESSLDGAASSIQSDGFTHLIGSKGRAGGEAEIVAEEIESLAGIVRKLFGHFGLFAVTAIPAMIFVILAYRDTSFRVAGVFIGLAIGCVVAWLSEFIQAFVPGRGPSWKDVGIDCAGFALTCAVFLIGIIIAYVVVKIRGKKEETIEI